MISDRSVVRSVYFGSVWVSSIINTKKSSGWGNKSTQDTSLASHKKGTSWFQSAVPCKKFNGGVDYCNNGLLTSTSSSCKKRKQVEFSPANERNKKRSSSLKVSVYSPDDGTSTKTTSARKDSVAASVIDEEEKNDSVVDGNDNGNVNTNHDGYNFLPAQTSSLLELYDMMMCEGTYHRIPEVCKSATVFDIEASKYRYAMDFAYNKLRLYAKQNKAEYHQCKEDDSDSDNSSSDDTYDDGTPYNRRPTHWWDDVLASKKGMMELLQVLAVNPAWDLSHRYKTSDVRGYVPCLCPFHKRFANYYKSMGITWLIQEYNIECTVKKGLFNDTVGLKSHCHNTGSWYHYYLKHYLVAFHECKPIPYNQDKIYPVIDDTVTLESKKVEEIYEEDTDDETVNQKSTHSVKG